MIRNSPLNTQYLSLIVTVTCFIHIFPKLSSRETKLWLTVTCVSVTVRDGKRWGLQGFFHAVCRSQGLRDVPDWWWWQELSFWYVLCLDMASQSCTWGAGSTGRGHNMNQRGLETITRTFEPSHAYFVLRKKRNKTLLRIRASQIKKAESHCWIEMWVIKCNSAQERPPPQKKIIIMLVNKKFCLSFQSLDRSQEFPTALD